MKRLEMWRATLSVALVVVLASCGQPSATAPSAEGAPGLSAVYQGSGSFEWQKVEQTDSVLAFDWGTLSAVEGMMPGAFSAQWTGQLVAPESGDYTLSLEGQGSASLSLDGRSVVGMDGSSQVRLEAGRAYSLKLDYRKTGAEAAVILRWNLPGKAAEVVPPSAFRHAAGLESTSVRAQAVTTGVNLLRNGNFESGTGAWVRYGGTRALEKPGRDGTGSALAVSNFGWVQQDLPKAAIEAGQKYRFKLWGRAASGACTVGVASGGTGATNRRTLQFTGGWSQRELEFTAEAGVQWMAVYLTSPSTLCAYDDVELVAVSGTVTPPPPATADNPVVNGDFDFGTQGWNIIGGKSQIVRDQATGFTTPALQLSEFAWGQQNLDVKLLDLTRPYNLSIPVNVPSVNGQSGTCRAGLVVGNADGSTTQLANKDFSTDGSVDETFTFPATTQWAAIYLVSTSSLPCQFDGILMRRQSPTPSADWKGIAYPGAIGYSGLVDIGFDPQNRPVVVATQVDPPPGGGPLDIFGPGTINSLRVVRYENGVGQVLGGVVDPAFPTGIFRPRLAFNDSGNPVVAYATNVCPNRPPGSGMTPRFACIVVRQWTGSAWQGIGPVIGQGTGITGGAIRLLWKNRAPWVVYRTSAGVSIALENWNGTAWQTAAPTIENAIFTDAQLNRAGDVVVAYTSGGGAAKVDRLAGTAWQNVYTGPPVISTTGYNNATPAMALDSQDRPVLVTRINPTTWGVIRVGTGQLGTQTFDATGTTDFAPVRIAMNGDNPVVLNTDNLLYRWTGSSWVAFSAPAPTADGGYLFGLGVNQGTLYAVSNVNSRRGVFSLLQTLKLP